jgi:hypothetical protein
MFKTTSGAPYYFNFHEPLDSRIEIIKREGIESNNEDTSGQKALASLISSI